MELDDRVVEGVQVFFLQSPLPVPSNVAVHTWVVVCDEDCEYTRYEVMEFDDLGGTSWGYVYKDLFSPMQGMPVAPWLYWWTPHWTGTVFDEVTGDTARRIRTFLEEEVSAYPWCDTYHYVPGPNSNTFTQWVIDECDVDVELSWRAFGKGYGGRNC